MGNHNGRLSSYCCPIFSAPTIVCCVFTISTLGSAPAPEFSLLLHDASCILQYCYQLSLLYFSKVGTSTSLSLDGENGFDLKCRLQFSYYLCVQFTILI